MSPPPNEAIQLTWHRAFYSDSDSLLASIWGASANAGGLCHAAERLDLYRRQRKIVVNWEAIGAVGEIIGAFAVVLSLLYLAIQIRSQNRESRIASVHELNESFRSATTSFQNPNLADVFARAKDDFESLPETERLQFISMVQGIMRVWEDAFHQHQQKRLNDTQWQAMVRIGKISRVFGTTDTRRSDK